MLTSPWFRWNYVLTSAEKNAPALRRGFVGYAARVLQLALIDQGFKLPKSTAKHGSPDGRFGQETKSRVRSFQKKHGLSQDGVVGQNTMRKLDELVRTPWNPPRPIGGPGDVMKTSDNARIAVLETLAGSRVQSINFYFQGTTISGHDYLRVAKEVDDDVIVVETTTIQNGLGKYIPQGNVVQLPFFTANTPKRRSAIVHEMTHAIMDGRGIGITTVKSEALAWIAQCLYLQISGVDTVVPGFGVVATPVYEAANRCARTWRKSHRFEDKDVAELEDAISSVPQYAAHPQFPANGFRPETESQN
ncbi:MAG: peptidoglycan-binding domain-containing protein [Planctomycetota bacterium]